MTDWRDELADVVRRLEKGVNDHDRKSADQARIVLRTLRHHEVRLRRISLRARVMFDDGPPLQLPRGGWKASIAGQDTGEPMLPTTPVCDGARPISDAGVICVTLGNF